MPPRLLSAFAVSLVLHGALVLPEFVARRKAAPPPAPLQAQLRQLPPPEPLEPLLKNTLDAEERPIEAPPPPRSAPAAATPRPATKPAAPREIQAAQRKLSKHIFYPPEAVARGIEGEVRLILKLGAEGHVDDVLLAATSGHAILDNAAIKAAYAMGSLTGASGRELILPVIFRLQ